MNRSKFVVKQITRSFFRKYSTPPNVINPSKCSELKDTKRFIVSVMEAGSNPSAETIAFLLKQNPMVKELRIYDDVKDICGTAYDLSDIDTSCKVKAYMGEHYLKECLKGAHIVVTLGGRSSNPNENYEDLFYKNCDDIRRIATYLTEFNHDAVFVIGKPPAEALVPMVFEEYKKADVKNPETKIIGAANYVSMRTNYFIAKYLGVDAFYVTCPLIGGVHCPQTLVAVLSQSIPGWKITDHKVIAEIQNEVANGEQSILKVKMVEGGGTLNYTPAFAVYRLVNNVLKGLHGDQDAIDCSFLRQSGDIQRFLKYMTSICVFGRNGVFSTHMPHTSGGEIHLLRSAYPHLKRLIHLGEHYVTGKPFPTKRMDCATPCDIYAVKSKEQEKMRLEPNITDPTLFDRCNRFSLRQVPLSKAEAMKPEAPLLP